MYGKILSFLFSIVLTKYLLTSVQDYQDKTAFRKYGNVWFEARGLADKIDNFANHQEKNQLKRDVKMDISPTRSEQKNVTMKTPISVLHELLAKLGKTPSYACTLDLNTGNFHCTTSFVDKSAVGIGTKKQAAKQQAAKLLLDKLAGRTIADEFYYNNTDVNNTVSNALNNSFGRSANIKLTALATNINSGNFVGALLEFSQKKLIKQPIYELEAEAIVSGTSRFGIHCTMGRNMTSGIGSSKKAAKHEAAKEMLILVKEQLKELIDEVTYSKFFKA